ncbi:lipase member K-like [Cimex lectularius]|uniref:Lipase n=1 Tax=Cimex lectularius TaxID=79782 RepID=A0A8I6SBF5_CIMLE|nr:lipase member K-like [Cimex lectularius]
MWWSEGILILLVAILLVHGEEGEDEKEEPTPPPPPPPPPLKPLPDLAKDYGYDAEKFEINSNGYTLHLYHIKGKTPGGPVVLMQHGVMASSDCWSIRNNSLAYVLADEGKDVWLSNVRGTVYGRKHEKFNPDTDEEFWKFNIHAYAFEDLPAHIDFVMEKTKATQIYYIGHSMGTTMFLQLMSSKPEYNAKIKKAVLLAPVYYCHKFQFMLSKGTSMYQMAVDTMKGFDEKKIWEAFPRSDVPKTEHQMNCSNIPDMAVSYCKMGMDMTKQYVGEFLPAGTSIYILKHFMQIYTEGVVKPYDFGVEENMKVYKNETPPNYDIKNIKTEVHTIFCESDQVVDPADAEALMKDLPNPGTSTYIKNEQFSHIDFLLPTSPEVEEDFAKLQDKIKEILKN